MKFLLIIGIALLVIWIWKSNRQSDIREAREKAPTQPKQKMVTTDMVACDVCHVHLPRSEALTGPKGNYCSDEHRKQAK